MKNEKILGVCGFYRNDLKNWEGILDFNPIYNHVIYMLDRIPEFIEDGRKEKANRWLGFIQGALWAQDVYTIEEMKGHNKPDEK